MACNQLDDGAGARVGARVEAGEVDLARELATRLGKPAAALPPEHSLVKLIRNFGRARDFRGVYACLDAQAYATPQQEWPP